MQASGKYKATLLALAVAGLGVLYAATPQTRNNIVQQLALLQPAAGNDVTLVSHKALYDFRLASAAARTGLTNIKGKMYFEQDDVCDAWTTDQRFTTRHHYAEKPAINNTSHYVTFESKDGRQFNFNSAREEDGEKMEQLRGSVDRNSGGGARAAYTRPPNLAYDLAPGYLLPAAHTGEMIRHARNGDNFFNAVLFDGTDADGPVEIGTVIGQKLSPDEIKKIAASNKKIDPTLLTPDAWHVRVAVFPLKDKDAITPAYEMDMVVHDNGVVSYALVDYTEFKVEQNLIALEKIPEKKCD